MPRAATRRRSSRWGTRPTLRRVTRAERSRPATSSANSAFNTSAGSQRWAFAVATTSGAWRRMCGSRSRRNSSSSSAGNGGADAVLLVVIGPPRSGRGRSCWPSCSPSRAQALVPWVREESSLARCSPAFGARAWWSRIEDRSASANRPCTAACPVPSRPRRGRTAWPAARASAILTRILGGACGGGLDQPQPGALAQVEELGLGRVLRTGLAVQWPGRLGGKCSSSIFGVPGWPGGGGRPRPGPSAPTWTITTCSSSPTAVGTDPHRRTQQLVRDRVLAGLEHHHRCVARHHPRGDPERDRVRVCGDRVQPGVPRPASRPVARRVTRCARVLTFSQNSTHAASSSANEPYASRRLVSLGTRSALLIFTDDSVPPLDAGSAGTQVCTTTE
jgi:hypothetical protein